MNEPTPVIAAVQGMECSPQPGHIGGLDTPLHITPAGCAPIPLPLSNPPPPNLTPQPLRLQINIQINLPALPLHHLIIPRLRLIHHDGHTRRHHRPMQQLPLRLGIRHRRIQRERPRVRERMPPYELPRRGGSVSLGGQRMSVGRQAGTVADMTADMYPYLV